MRMHNSAFMLFVLVWNSQFSEYPYYLVYGPQEDPGKWFNQHICAAYIGKDNSEDVMNF